MDWKQCTIPFGEDYLSIQEQVAALSAAHGSPKDVALFIRTSEDHANQVLLLSPPGVWLFGNSLPPTWESCSPYGFEWALLFANGDPYEHLGLRKIQPRSR